MPARTITFNNFSLQDTNFRTKDILYRHLPSKVVDVEANARRDGFRIKNVYYQEKEISVNGVLFCLSQTELDTKLNLLKELLIGQDQNLDITDSNTTYRYTATVTDVKIPEEHYNISHTPYNITFKCKPFLTTTSQITSTYLLSASSGTSTIIPTGSYGPNPILRWTCSGSPTLAIRSLTFSNSTTVKKITVNSLVLDNNGDYLEVDCDAQTVKVSYDGLTATRSDFVGVFPTFLPSTNSFKLKVTTSATPFVIKQTIKYYPTYL